MPDIMQEVLTALQQGRSLPVRPCSFCGYVCSYLWDAQHGLGYDAGCDCTRRYVIEARDKDDLASFVARNPGLIETWLCQPPTPSERGRDDA